ncbi:hypothetical protein LTS08_007326 [Lithohypha guttulata]|nr:hypothetical protein LTS08_007326 [Lithohypha guttulata]
MAMGPTLRAGLSPRHVSPPLYFPPPPTSATAQAESKKKGVKVSVKETSRSTSPSSKTLQKPPKPILKRRLTSTKRQRQWVLLALLVTSFTILILSVIFAYCAALPHSDNIRAAQAAANSTTSQTATTRTVHSLDNVNPATHSRKLRRDEPKYTLSSDDTQTKSVEEALAEDQQNAVRFSQPSAKASLTFYTALLPLLTLIHTSVELLTSLVRAETSQSSRLGDVLRFRQAGPDTDQILSQRRVGTLISFTVSALLLLGWTTMEFFWMNCEIIPFSAHNAEAVCPIQIRGHRMGGISELSVGKIVLGFAIMLGYAYYCIYLVRRVGVFNKIPISGAGSRVSSFRRRARFAKGQDTLGEDSRMDDVESVVIVIDAEKH